LFSFCLFGCLCTFTNAIFLMPWMCLEDCQADQVPYEIEQLKNYSSLFQAVSFKWCEVNSSGLLVREQVTDVRPLIQSLGLQTFPMICSENLDNMRQVFASPLGLINEAIAKANEWGDTGFNIDFEPDESIFNVTSQDAADFANFLELFAAQAHNNGLVLSVDVDRWGLIWNHTLNAPSVDKILDMDTYQPQIPDVQMMLEKDIKQYGIQRLGMGINTKYGYSDQQVEQLYQAIASSPIREVDIWAMPIPDNWWPMLQKLSESEL